MLQPNADNAVLRGAKEHAAVRRAWDDEPPDALATHYVHYAQRGHGFVINLGNNEEWRGQVWCEEDKRGCVMYYWRCCAWATRYVVAAGKKTVSRNNDKYFPLVSGWLVYILSWSISAHYWPHLPHKNIPRTCRMARRKIIVQSAATYNPENNRASRTKRPSSEKMKTKYSLMPINPNISAVMAIMMGRRGKAYIIHPGHHRRTPSICWQRHTVK